VDLIVSMTSAVLWLKNRFRRPARVIYRLSMTRALPITNGLFRKTHPRL
jgi:hypothetical protein